MLHRKHVTRTKPGQNICQRLRGRKNWVCPGGVPPPVQRSLKRGKSKVGQVEYLLTNIRLIISGQCYECNENILVLRDSMEYMEYDIATKQTTDYSFIKMKCNMLDYWILTEILKHVLYIKKTTL